MAKVGLNKKKIVEFAAQKANQIGINNITVRSLADELGIRAASLYNHIESFDELKTDIMNYGWKMLEKQMLQSVAGINGYDAIRAMCNAFYSFATENPGIFEVMLWYNKYASEDNNQTTDRMFEAIYRIFKSVYISQENTEHIIRTLRSFLQGFSMLVNNNSFGNPVSIEKSFEMSLDILISGIKQYEEKD